MQTYVCNVYKYVCIYLRFHQVSEILTVSPTTSSLNLYSINSRNRGNTIVLNIRMASEPLPKSEAFILALRPNDDTYRLEVNDLRL